MLIITADDYGKNVQATDRIFRCYQSGTVTSASAMVFMEDSERAAKLAEGSSLEIGLHLNLTEEFTSGSVRPEIRNTHAKVSRYLRGFRYAEAVFHPFLTGAFRKLVSVQWAEFLRLYGRAPSFVNGHHHSHLCMNVLAAGLVPNASRVRTPFTFKAGEKGRISILYRSFVARRLKRRFITPDSLYSIEPLQDTSRISRIAEEARDRDVELEVHPEIVEQEKILLSQQFRNLLGSAPLGKFELLAGGVAAG
jgi:chitin disaccharide deacetylase